MKRGKKEAPNATRRKKKVDEELDSDQTNEDGGIDDMDLRHDLHARPEDSGQEDEDETPAEKRLRLAQLYLDSVKEGLGMFYHFLRLSLYLLRFFIADGEFDAAEIDKELIAARLKQDVMEHSGKVHLFIADSVRIPYSLQLLKYPILNACYLVQLLITTNNNPPHTRPQIICNFRRRIPVLQSTLHIRQRRLH